MLTASSDASTTKGKFQGRLIRDIYILNLTLKFVTAQIFINKASGRTPIQLLNAVSSLLLDSCLTHSYRVFNALSSFNGISELLLGEFT